MRVLLSKTMLVTCAGIVGAVVGAAVTRMTRTAPAPTLRYMPAPRDWGTHTPSGGSGN